VAERTLTLWQRTEPMSLVLDTVEVGLATRTSAGASARAIASLGSPSSGRARTGRLYFEHIAGGDAKLTRVLELDWAQISDGFMPLEVRLGPGAEPDPSWGDSLCVGYKAILAGDELKGALLTVSDVTSDLATAALKPISREQVKVSWRIIGIEQASSNFFDEAQRLVASIEADQFGSVADSFAPCTLSKAAPHWPTGKCGRRGPRVRERPRRRRAGTAAGRGARARFFVGSVSMSGILPLLGHDPAGAATKSVAASWTKNAGPPAEEGCTITERILFDIQGETAGKHLERAADQLRSLSQKLGSKASRRSRLSALKIGYRHALCAFWSAFATWSHSPITRWSRSMERSLAGKSPRNRVLLSAR